MKKSTNKELVTELELLNKDGRLDVIIQNAKSNHYHDYKNPPGIICGKMEFVSDASFFPELANLSNRIKSGEFDEEADEEDKAEMRKDLPPSMWAKFGLNPLN